LGEDIEKAYILHAKDVYKYLLSITGGNTHLSEELTQETFFRAMRTINSFDGSCKLSVWLCQIAKHLWYQHLQKQAKRRHDELSHDLQGDNSPEDNIVLRSEKTALYKAIRTLPENMREVVHLRLTGEFTFAEIGEILGKTETWARTTFYLAKLKIIEKMEEKQ